MASWKTTLLLLTLFLLSLFLELLLAQATIINSIDGGMNKGCIEVERKALLEFKNGLKDPSGRLSSWVGADCCKWKGVDCNNQTGHVVKVDLKSGGGFSRLGGGFSRLGGEISGSLLDLKHLTYLDLSLNDFQGIPIPNFLGSFERLRYLNLSNARFGGMIPPHLGNLSHHFPQYSNPFVNLTSVSVIDLSYNNFNTTLPGWLFNISTLMDLYLNGATIKGPIPRVNLGSLRNLVTLDLSFNYIGSEAIELVNGLSTCTNNSLEWLNLGYNQFGGQLPDSLGLFKNLKYLNLMNNSFVGPFPNSIQHLTNLEILYLIENFISGPIPTWIGNLRRMKRLDLSNNLMNGTIPKSIGQLRELTELYLDWNSWEGSRIYRGLQLPYAIPEWLWKQDFSWLDLSRNQLYGTLPNSLSFSQGALVDLSFNHLGGPLPLRLNVGSLYLGNNSFSGPIPLNIGELSSLEILDVSCNLLNGSIPSSISKLKYLGVINLSNNHLSGKIPKNWNDLPWLDTVDLSKNKMSGGIPSWMCSKSSLTQLILGDNNLSGEPFPSLRNYTGLYSLDLGNNRFSGEIPKWIGERMPSLEQLRLRGNMLTGDIPEQLCWLSHLHILDLAVNNLSGSIPQCLGNLTALSFVTLLDRNFDDPNGHVAYSERMELVVKGQNMEFDSILPIVNLIDLSSNNIWGEIPKEITNLSTLGTLNLSRNQLTGKIPEKIGAMQGLETLDLSCNCLSGPIPPSMSSITSLNHLNLSHNRLSGPIPKTNQFSTFNDPSIYEANLRLCGPPLSTNCSTLNDQDHKDEEEDEDEWDMSWFFISMGLGFPVGFWVVCGSLVLRSLRGRHISGSLMKPEIGYMSSLQ
ncbi:Receptor-like protein 12 [Vitis vinifera]|uniref:Receptor-like protein 12 n=1 Tax=Vitis vinifera TaxID=29760 RepID=A0A438FS43_VITVI|nr:Receptor-like protein 12 [Vitis vinifera]